MALFDDYRKPEAAPGEWVVFADDPDNGQPVRFRVRVIPFLVSRKFAVSKGRNEKVEIADESGKRRTQLQRLYDTDESFSVLVENATWACTEVENLRVRMKDEGSRDFFASQSGVAGLSVGDEVVLDKCWNEAVKRYIFQRQTDLALWIFQKADEMEKAAKLVQDDDEGNS